MRQGGQCDRRVQLGRARSARLRRLPQPDPCGRQLAHHEQGRAIHRARM